MGQKFNQTLRIELADNTLHEALITVDILNCVEHESLYHSHRIDEDGRTRVAALMYVTWFTDEPAPEINLAVIERGRNGKAKAHR